MIVKLQPSTFLLDNKNYIFLFVALVLAFLRSPALFLDPRFWAEEGVVFFRNAFVVENFFSSLFFLETKAGGYYNLPAVFGTAMAALLPIERAPAGTAIVSLIFCILPLWVYLVTPSYLGNSDFKRLAFISILSFGLCATPEVWLNTINSQVYCGLVGVVLLLQKTENLTIRTRLINFILLIICGLSGIYTTFLFPAFLLKAVLEKTPGAKLYLCANFLTSTIQGACFLYLSAFNQLSVKKFAPSSWYEKVSNAVLHHFLEPLIPTPYRNDIWKNRDLFQVFTDTKTQGDSFFAVTLLVIVAIFFYFLYLCKRNHTFWILLVALAVTSIFTTVASVGGVPGGRYGFLPGTIILLLILNSISTEQFQKYPFRTTVCSCLLFFSLAYGFFAVYMAKPDSRESITLCKHRSCPSWKSEIDKWRADPSYRPVIWPNEPWKQKPVIWRVRLMK